MISDALSDFAMPFGGASSCPPINGVPWDGLPLGQNGSNLGCSERSVNPWSCIVELLD